MFKETGNRQSLYNNGIANLNEEWLICGLFSFNPQLQHEARLSLEYLDSSFMDGFEILFMKSVPFIQTFDQFLQ